MHAAGAERFSNACKQLHIAARINAEGVRSTIDLYALEADLETTQMVCDSLSFAMAQVAHFSREMILLCLDLEEAAARSTAVGNEMPDDVRWIRTYVLGEGSGALGTVCIYQASSEDAIREHAAQADLPISEILPVADTVVVREDP